MKFLTDKALICLSLELLGLAIIAWPNMFKNLLKQLKTPATLIIFILVVAIIGSEVWVSYILYWITHNEIFLIVASAGLFFWNVVPCTPFIPICMGITLGIVKLRAKIKSRHA